MIAETVTIDILQIQSINRSMHTRVLSPMWEVALIQQEFLENNVITQFIYYIKKELSRTVVRELLPRATAHGHQTFPDYGRHTRSRSKGGDVREEAPAKECAAKNLQTNVRHLHSCLPYLSMTCPMLWRNVQLISLLMIHPSTPQSAIPNVLATY